MSHQQTKSIIEGELISSYLYEASLIAEAIIEEITSNISENTNLNSRLKRHQCICMLCPDGPDSGELRCKGADGKCSSKSCNPTAIPTRSASPTELISRDFIE